MSPAGNLEAQRPPAGIAPARLHAKTQRRCRPARFSFIAKGEPSAVDRGGHRGVPPLVRAAVFAVLIMGGIVGGYIVKSAVGIDMLPGPSVLHPMYDGLRDFRSASTLGEPQELSTGIKSLLLVPDRHNKWFL